MSKSVIGLYISIRNAAAHKVFSVKPFLLYILPIQLIVNIIAALTTEADMPAIKT